MSAVQALATLQEIVDLLVDGSDNCVPLDPPPCRAGVYPGQEVPWDFCGGQCGGNDGQLFANLSGMDVRQEGPCQRITFTAEVGILRCAAPMADDGTPPSAAAISADADQQAQDADAIWNAISCCTDRSEDLRGIVLVSWRALGPTGGCVGGAWIVRGVIDTCC